MIDLKKRESNEDLDKERIIIDSLIHFKDIFNSISTVSLVLNSFRQIIFASNDFLKNFDLTSDNSIFGLRFGEVLSCIHAKESPHGCNNSNSCYLCGAFQAVLESEKTNQKVQKETRITTNKNGDQASLELSISSVPIKLSNKQFYIVTIIDISSEKRKLQLERIFIHDLVNSAGGISGLSDVLEYSLTEETKTKAIDLIGKTSKVLLDQIISFRNILSAESGELEVKYSEVFSGDLIDEAIVLVSNNKSLHTTIVKDANSENILFVSDKLLVNRILVNMLKNAAESEKNPESIITIGSKLTDDTIKFWVKNNGIIPDFVQKQIFQRSFSTKGSNRGLGTYSMKLLGEKYLKGKVGFISNENDKTQFYIELPYKK
ncbi:sensor histidine kinase [Polaribacter sp.]|uniref:sensor histidine kinase n=1 Tax=Polaribacter sp. TaxID=1920175 RepID=UPI004048A67A